jgi:N-acetylglucosaminyl-diphospho-decaprenol L-rhamnosyltransferase
MHAAPPAVRPVTVSIVLHGQWAKVQPLLDDLQRHCAAHVQRVVLTVNRPEPDVDTSRWSLPIHRIDNAAPKGFGANHNAAFAACDTPWFLVLNPDLRFETDVLGPLVAAAGQRTGLLTPRIQEPGKPQPEPFRRLLTPLELLDRRSAHHVPPAHPDWVAGMFMLLRREAFAQVGGFDERFFMYCEDFDLCARLRLAGWNLQVAQQMRVLHEAQRASNMSLRPLAWHLASFAKVWTSGAFWRYRRLLAGSTR